MVQLKILEKPEQSYLDSKIYKIFVLENGLRALLISEPKTEYNSSSSSSDDAESSSSKSNSSAQDTDSDASEEDDDELAACAILIEVGSFAQPSKYQGLAHLMERMILLGSEKYPIEFEEYVKKGTVYNNVKTNSEETLFCFAVADEQLDSSMDYYAALMRAPLIKKQSMARQCKTVDSEFQEALQDDDARRDQLLASLATAGYPHNTFAYGNLKSLQEGINDDELHEALKEFYKRHYSAHRMIVCVQAHLQLEELEQLVVKHFAGIPSNNLPPVDVAAFNYHQAFTADFHELVYFVKPVDEHVCKLELTWVLPPMRHLYKCKPDQFMSYIIGHEGEGSLCAYLGRKDWSIDLTGGTGESGFDNNCIYTLFTVCIYLTPEGFKHVDDVLAATFAYIKLLTCAQAETLLETYGDLQNIELTNFRFQREMTAYDNVQDLAMQTRNYPPKHIITGEELFMEYDAQQVKQVLSILNEFKFNIMLTSQEDYAGVIYDKKEKWFGTEYASIKMPQKFLDLWHKCQPIPGLNLPKRNQFITKNFRILSRNSCTAPELFPKCLLKTDTGELWFKQDDKFGLPRTRVYLYLISPLLRQSAKNASICAVYARLLKIASAEQLYPASIAGLYYKVFACKMGLMMKIWGYNEKLHLVVEILTKNMKSQMQHITANDLDFCKQQQKKIYFNALIKPNALSRDVRLCVIENLRWSLMEKYNSLDDVTLQDIHDFAKTYSNELFVQALIQGNYTEESALNVMNSVLNTLDCQTIKELRFVENRIVQMPLGVRNICCRALNEEDVDTLVSNYYQIGPASVQTQVMLEFLMVFVEEPLGKAQLGSAMDAKMCFNYGINGYSIEVKSEACKASADRVDARIEAFRENIFEILQNTDTDDFEELREFLIETKKALDMSLGKEMARNWAEITMQEYFFDRRCKELEFLHNLTKNDLLAFLLKNESANKRKLSIKIIGRTQPLAEPSSDSSSGSSSSSSSSGSSSSGSISDEDTDFEDEDSDDSASSDNIDEYEVDELLFKSLQNKLHLTFLPSEDAHLNIVDVNEFKRNAEIFPVTKTKLDDSKDDEVPEPAQFTED